MIDETFLTTEEVLEYLQVNLRTVYRLIKAGKIPAVRVGRQWRFRKRDIDAWLDSQRPRGGSRPTTPVSRTVAIIRLPDGATDVVISMRPSLPAAAIACSAFITIFRKTW